MIKPAHIISEKQISYNKQKLWNSMNSCLSLRKNLVDPSPYWTK